MPYSLVMVALAMISQNFGPNATTYIVPSVVFNVLHKATCHGICSAAGKLGAIFAAQVFVYLAGAYCPGSVCSKDSSNDEVTAGLRVSLCYDQILPLILLSK